MPLSPKDRLGIYEIVARLGAGGMGEVYRARDAKLGRDVAIKVLPPDVAGDADRLARFKREAQVLASLNHPNIAAIYGLDEAAGQPFLVLELVEGEDLAERLKRGPIPVDEAEEIAKQIAQALEDAHEKGIVHRDLKPANVKVRPDGVVKVLDFGLARAFAAEAISGAPGAVNSPTLTTPAMTRAGMILGTAAYMSPEQARGKTADRRADVWAFGALLFELLTGEQAFRGEEITDTIVSVITGEPAWSKLPAATPAALRRLIARCLRKDPKSRLQSIGEARVQIEELLSGTAEEPVAAPASRPVVPRWAFVALSLGLAAAALLLWAPWRSRASSPDAGERPALRATLALPGDLTLRKDDRSVAISADGTQVAAVLHPKDGSAPPSLYLRDLSRLEFRQLPGTEGAGYPFFSPDGKSIAFFVVRELKRIDLADGIVRVVCSAPAGRGGTWSAQGTIVFAPSAVGGLSIVDAAGGAPSPITEPASPSESHRVPGFLPDGRRFLYYAQNAEKQGVYAFDPVKKESRFVIASDTEAVFVEPSSLVFARAENLVVQPFDLERLELTGSPKPIAAGVNWDTNRAALDVGVSSRGILVYQAVVRARAHKLAWMDLKGERTPIPVEPLAIVSGSLSSDGRRAVVSTEGDRGEALVAALDLERGITTPIGDADTKRYFGAVLSPDGQRIITTDANYSSQRILSFPFGGGASTELMAAEPGYEMTPSSITPDGHTLLYERRSLRDKMNDITMFALDGREAGKPLMVTPESEGDSRISPSGDVVAYLSWSVGQPSVVKLVTYPTPSTPVQVSPSAGTGTYGWLSAAEFFWMDRSSKVWSASVASKGGRLDVGAPKAMLGGRSLDEDTTILAFDVSRARFLVAIEEGTPEEPQLILVSGWRP